MITFLFIIWISLIMEPIQYAISSIRCCCQNEMRLVNLHSYCEDPFLVDLHKQSSMYHMVGFVWTTTENQYDEEMIEPYVVRANIDIDSVQRGFFYQNTYIEEGIDSLDRPIYINFWNRGTINSTLAEVPDRIVYLYMGDFIVVIQFQNFMEYNGPSLRSNTSVDVLKVELVYTNNGMVSSCDITPFLGENWEMTTDITTMAYKKINEIPFYKYTHLAYNH